jgi:mRNA interferase MazF
LRRGEIYRTHEKVPERSHKPGFYVIVSRDFIAGNDDISTVICAPVYTEALGLKSEVVLGAEDGLPQDCSVRCDFLTLMFKRKLTHFVGTLSSEKKHELNRALTYALQLGGQVANS